MFVPTSCCATWQVAELDGTISRVAEQHFGFATDSVLQVGQFPTFAAMRFEAPQNCRTLSHLPTFFEVLPLISPW